MIRLYKGCDRNTQAHIVEFGQYRMYFSYQTCVAVDSPYGRFRMHNNWGPTTGRHFKDMNVYDYPMVDDTEMFQRAVESIGTEQCEASFVAMTESLQQIAA